MQTDRTTNVDRAPAPQMRLRRLRVLLGAPATTRLRGRFTGGRLAGFHGAGPANRWTWATAALPTTATPRRGNERRQPFGIALLSDERDVATLIVCDGWNDAPFGGTGATIAARTLADCAGSWMAAAGRWPERSTVSGWLLLARDRIRSVAAERRADPCDFAMTAIVASSNGEKTDVCHVGSGAVLARRVVDGRWSVVSVPEGSAFANSNAFLDDDGTSDMRWQLHEERHDGLVVVTRGLEAQAIDLRSGSPRAAFLEPITRPSFVGASFGYSQAHSSALTSHLGGEDAGDDAVGNKSILLAYRG